MHLKTVLYTCPQVSELHLDLPGLVWTTGAFAAPGRVYCLHHTGVSCTWTHCTSQTTRACAAPGLVYTTEACDLYKYSTVHAYALHYRSLSFTGTCMDNSIACAVWTCIHHRGPSCTWTCLHYCTDVYAALVHVYTTRA